MNTPYQPSYAARTLRRLMQADQKRSEKIPSLGKKCRVIAEGGEYAAPVGMLVWVKWTDYNDPTICTVVEATRKPVPEHLQKKYVNLAHTLRVIPQKQK